MQKGTTSRVMVASRPKVIFGQMASTIPKITDDHLYTVFQNKHCASDITVGYKLGIQMFGFKICNRI
jgi:hypothetical protein